MSIPNKQKRGSSTSTRQKAVYILKIARPRTWTFSIISFLFAYLGSSSLILWEILVGIVLFALLTGATNLINAYTDIEEDSVNNPIRVDWINRLGLKNLKLSIIITYILVLMSSLPFNALFKGVIVIAIFDSILYSLPPIRLKKYPVTALIAFSGAVGFPFLAGLAAIHSLELSNPFFLFFTYFMLTYGAVKNIPDYTGDKLAGLETTATIFNTYKKAVIASTLFLVSPYLLLTLFIILQVIPTLYLLNLPFIIFPISWAYQNLKAKCREDIEELHTYGFVYAISFFLFNLILSYPSALSVVITTLILSTIYLLTKYNIDSRIRLTLNNNYIFEDGEKIGSHRY